MTFTITTTTETSSTIEQRMLGSGPGLPPALPNYPAQSATTIDGSSAALFGLPFMVAGVFIGLAAFDVIQTRKHAPLWLIAILARGRNGVAHEPPGGAACRIFCTNS